MTEIRVDHFLQFAMDQWHWPNFTPVEIACRGTGKLLIVLEFMDKLQRLRERLSVPLVISSGYRTPEYNAEVSSTGLTGPHTTGRAVDIKVNGEPAWRLLSIAGDSGFHGIGVSQKGAHASCFIHIDDVPNETHPRPWVWSY